MSLTVVPIHNLDLPAGIRVPFGKAFVLQDVPVWVKQDKHILADIGRTDRDLTLLAKQALVAEYYADSFGFADPEWTGPKPRSIQKLRFEAASLANMAIWLIQPSQVCFTVGFKALTILDGRTLDTPVINSTQIQGRYYCHPKESENRVLPKRYPLFWQGLESLFGDNNDTPGLSRRLRERISFFLADTPATQQQLCEAVKTCYKTRCEIVHGRWNNGPEMAAHMEKTEAIVRTVLRHIVEKPGMLGGFLSPNRDKFLASWVKSGAFTPPPLP